MIKSNLGKVHLTRPNYKLCDILNVPKEEVDLAVEAGLGVDLASILRALADTYGSDKALEMWTRSAELFIDYKKGE